MDLNQLLHRHQLSLMRLDQAATGEERRSHETECSVATMREAEAFIRCNTPRPKARSTFWDRDALEG